MNIVIPYKPRVWAGELHITTKRWIVMVLHRRAGKTTAILNHLQRDCIRVPNSQYAFIAPTYKQAKRIGWEILKEIARPISGTVANEVDLTLRYPTGSKIFLAGSENIDSLRGIPLWGGAQDESAMQSPNLFSEVISKCLADHLGYWIWAGTPKGKNSFHKTYQTALNNPEEYTTIYKTIDDSLNKETGVTIDNLRQAVSDDRRLVSLGEMTQEEFDQEWYCSFEASIKGAYYSKEIAELRKTGRFKFIPYDPALNVHTVCDLGVGQNLVIGFYQKVANEVRMIDFWQGQPRDGLVDAIRAMKNKPYVYGKHFAPHDVKATEIATGKTRLQTAKELGIEYKEVPHLSVDDGINKGKLFFSKLWVSTTCEWWLDAMSQYHQEWDEKRNDFVTSPYKDWTSHGADVHRYAALVVDQFDNELESQPEFVSDFKPISKFEPSLNG
jgi:phage terminase large subunit